MIVINSVPKLNQAVPSENEDNSHSSDDFLYPSNITTDENGLAVTKGFSQFLNQSDENSVNATDLMKTSITNNGSKNSEDSASNLVNDSEVLNDSTALQADTSVETESPSPLLCRDSLIPDSPW